MRSDKKRNSILVVCIVLSITCIGIKLFSSQFYYSYEPVTGIMLRSLPSLDNYKKNPQPNDGYIILCDENSFQGEIVYRTVVEWLWFFLPLVTIALVFKRKLSMHVVKERCYKVIPTVVTLGTILLFCGVLFKIIANHGQFFFNHVFGIVISVFAAILVVTFEAAGCVNRWTKSFLVIHSILVLLYIGAFYTNTLLPYETWLDKNMPESSFQKLTSK